MSDNTVKNHTKWSNGNENQCRITPWNGLNRCWIRQVVLYLYSTGEDLRFSGIIGYLFKCAETFL